MEPWMGSALITAIGSVFLVRNATYARDEARLRAYLQRSPKPILWVSRLGLERTVDLSKRYFVPAGILVSAGVCAWGLVRLARNL